MTVTAAAGVFSIAEQAAKVGGGTFTVGDYTWYRYKAQQIDYGIVTDERVMPPEIGGTPTPTGAYRTGQYVAGGAVLLPRMEGDFGYILKALMGSASTVPDSPEAGLNTHIFRFDPNSSFTIPWLAARKHVPGEVESYGEIGYDNKVVAASFGIPQVGQLTARVDMIGRVGLLDENPSWTYADDYEEFESIPVACNGYFRLPTLDFGQEQPVVGVTIDMANGVTTPAEEMIIGSLHPDDFATRTRGMTVRARYKWNNPNMYQRIIGGGISSETWTPSPYTTEAGDEGYAFECKLESPANISGYSNPYSLEIRASKVVWAVAGSPVLQAGGIVILDLVGTVLAPSSGDYAQFVVVNEQASY